MERARRALTVTRVARRTGLRRVLAEIGLVGHREATREELEQGALKIGFVPTGLGEL